MSIINTDNIIEIIIMSDIGTTTSSLESQYKNDITETMCDDNITSMLYQSIVDEETKNIIDNVIDNAYWKYAYNCERIYISYPVLEQHKNMQIEYKTFDYECKQAIYNEFTKRRELKKKLESYKKQLVDAENSYNYEVITNTQYTISSFELNTIIKQINNLNKEIEESTKKIEYYTRKTEQYQIKIPYVCAM